jgi:spermidine synthase
MSQRKIRGSIICHRRDEFGEMIIAEHGPMRSLYFGDGVLQSSIRLDQPGMLLGEYNHAIASALLFKDAPQSVLLIGLGGCSIINFLLTSFPECAVDAVEIRQGVIDLAQDFFLIPGENANLNIIHAAGQDFISQKEPCCYDIIIVDAFDDDGPAAALSELSFFKACRERLKENGICVLNLWHRPKDKFPVIYTALQKAFSGNTLKLIPDEKYWNVIVFGFAGTCPSQDMAGYRQAAKRLKQSCGVNFPKYLTYMCRQNFS